MALPNSRDEPLIDFAADIAKAANHFLFIQGNYLHLVDRIQTSTPVRYFKRPELLALKINPAYPIKQVYTEYEFNIPYPDTVMLAQEVKRVVVSNLAYGEELEFQALSTVEEENLLFLRNLLTTESLAQSEALINGIITDVGFGDRVEVLDERAAVKVTMTVTNKIFDFELETTVLRGPSTIDFVVTE